MKMTKKMIEKGSQQMFMQCIKDATAKEDGKNHEVKVILSDFRYPFYGRQQWLSGCIDDRREYGGKLGLGSQTVLHKCIVYALKNSDVEKCASIERHTDSMLKKNEVIVGLRKEIAELRECLEQAYGDKIGTYTMKGNEVDRWRKALKGAEDEDK